MANRLTEVRYPASYGLAGNPRRTANVSYDKTSRLDTLQFNSQTQMNSIAYNDFGQATSISIGAGGSNPITETYSFDTQTGLMSGQKVQRGLNTLMELEYDYDRGGSKGSLNGTTGQLTKIIDNKDRNKDRVYEFDTLGRLITAKGGLAAGAAAPATANWTQGYTYDRYGNKLTTTSTGYTAGNQTIPLDGLALQSIAPTTNRITTAGYSYDKAGNVTRGKSPTGSWQNYEYDTAGRLRYVKDDTGWIQQSNEYASSRERLASWSYASVDITYYAWGGSSVLAEYTTQSSSSSLTWQKSYVYAGSRLLSTITNTAGNEVTEYHHPDRLGTRLISNPTTATQNEQLTLPFGTLIGAETSATNDKRFTSYDRSEIAGGLDYAVNRNYNSGQSRFTQVDPIGMASASIGNPQSLNLFAYVQNNPIDFVDPSGLYEACVHEAMTRFLGNLAGLDSALVNRLAGFTGDSHAEAADAEKWAATSSQNIARWLRYGDGPWTIHFPIESELLQRVGRYSSDIAQSNFQNAGFTLHSLQDGLGAHTGYRSFPGHAGSNIGDAIGTGTSVDRILGDEKFIRAALATLNTMSGGNRSVLSPTQINQLINAIISGCGKNFDFQITRPPRTIQFGGGGGGGNSNSGYYPYYYYWSWTTTWAVIRRTETTVTILDDEEVTVTILDDE